jgi:hypothetical protein
MQFINKSHDAVHAQNSQAVFSSRRRRHACGEQWSPHHATAPPAPLASRCTPRHKTAGSACCCQRALALPGGEHVRQRCGQADARGQTRVGAACRQAPGPPPPRQLTRLCSRCGPAGQLSRSTFRARGPWCAALGGWLGPSVAARGRAAAWPRSRICGIAARSLESWPRKTAWSHHRGLTAAAAPMLDIFHFSMTQDTSSAPVRPHCASGARGSAPLGGRRVRRGSSIIRGTLKYQI